jgi:hypothetical protein
MQGEDPSTPFIAEIESGTHSASLVIHYDPPWRGLHDHETEFLETIRNRLAPFGEFIRRECGERFSQEAVCGSANCHGVVSDSFKQKKMRARWPKSILCEEFGATERIALSDCFQKTFPC